MSDCMWCRYGDHPDGPFCPKHGDLLARGEITRLRAECDKWQEHYEALVKLRNGIEAERDAAVLRATRAEERVERLEAALEASVKLQSHYALLLNMHDGGERMTFATAALWLARLDFVRHGASSPPGDGGAKIANARADPADALSGWDGPREDVEDPGL